MKYPVSLNDVSTRFLGKAALAIAALLAVLQVASQLGSLLLQFAIAVILSIAVDTVVRGLQRRGMRRGFAITTVLLFGLVTTVLFALALVGPLLDGVEGLAKAAPDVVDKLTGSTRWHTLAEALHLDDDVPGKAGKLATRIPDALGSALASVVGTIFGLVNMLLMVIFLVTGGHSIVGLVVRLWPRVGEGAAWTIVRGAYENIGHYVLGATFQALLAGASLTIVLRLVDTPYALALGLLMFLLDFIPLIGATLGSIPAVAVTLFAQGWTAAFIVLAFLIVYQQIENAIIQPRIQGKVVRLPAIAVFFSVCVGGELLGVVGALLAVPVASIVAIVVREWLTYVGRAGFEPPHLFDDMGRPVS